MAPRIRYKKCFFRNCSSNSSHSCEHIRFFHFPKYNTDEWIRACGKIDAAADISRKLLLMNYYVCSLHFDNYDYTKILSSLRSTARLKKCSVPKLLQTTLDCTCNNTNYEDATDRIEATDRLELTDSLEATDLESTILTIKKDYLRNRKDNETSSASSSVPSKKMKTEIDTPRFSNVDTPLELFSSYFFKELIAPTSPPPMKQEPVTLPNQPLQKRRKSQKKVSIENQVNLNSNNMSVHDLKETKNTSTKINKQKNKKIPTIPVSQQRNDTIYGSIESKTNSKEQSNQSKLPSKKKKSLEERFKKSQNIVKGRDGSYYSIHTRKRKRTNNKNDRVKRICIDDVMEVLHDILPPFLRICLEYQLCKFRKRQPAYQYQMKKLSTTLLAYMGKRAYEFLALMMPLQNVEQVKRNLKNPQFRPDIELFKMESNDRRNFNLLSKTFDLRPEDSNYRYIKVDHSDEEIIDEDIDESEGEDETNEETEPVINWFSGDLEDDLNESEEEYLSDDEIVVEFDIPTENMSYNDIINTESNKYDVIDEKNFITIKQEDITKTYIEGNNETSIIYPESEIKKDSYHKPKLKKDVHEEIDYSVNISMPYIDCEENESKTTKLKHKYSKRSRLNVKNR